MHFLRVRCTSSYAYIYTQLLSYAVGSLKSLIIYAEIDPTNHKKLWKYQFVYTSLISLIGCWGILEIEKIEKYVENEKTIARLLILVKIMISVAIAPFFIKIGFMIHQALKKKKKNSEIELQNNAFRDLV